MVVGFDGSRAFVSDRTGTENYSHQLLRALAKLDRKNQYVVYVRPSLAGRPLGDWPKNFQFLSSNFQFFWTQVGLAIQTFKDNLDVLFVPAHTLPVIRKPGLKTVITVHDLGSEYLPSMHQLKQRLYLSYMQKIQLKTATKIIAVSQATKQDLSYRLGVAQDKVKVVYEGYDRKLFYNKKKLFKPVKGDLLVNSLRQYGLRPGGYFLFVGTVQPRKNLERLIKAFAKWFGSFGHKAPRTRPSRSLQVGFVPENNPIIKSVVHETAPVALIDSNFAIPYLVIVGKKGWMSDGIYELPKKLGIEDRVKFLGYVLDGDLPILYSGAVALTFPSLFEGFGLPILEAQACGCPVLTSNQSSMPEVGGKGAIYVDPYAQDDIVEGMIKCQMPNVKCQMIKAGFENIKRFSWEKCARETLAVLENLKCQSSNVKSTTQI